MERELVSKIIRKFDELGVRYLIAGGFAVVAHGYNRFTADLDLILGLDSENALKALAVLKEEGYEPKIPVPIEQFADAQLRRDWVENCNMVAFPLWSEQHRTTGIDLFVTEPLDFETSFARRFREKLPDGTEANFVSLDDLLKLKRDAARPKDLQDIYYLLSLRHETRTDAAD